MISPSYAKINLSLRILQTKENGYHELEMVNLPLELHDTIEISPLTRYQDTYIVCEDVGLLSMSENICQTAFDRMKAKYKFTQNFMIHIHKSIPFSAGLGGGSSNAATVLSSLNQLLRLGASREELSQIALDIGADVPFFLLGRPALAEGIGEKLTPIPVEESYYCLLVKPEQGLSTKDVYAASDRFPRGRIDTQGVLKGLKEDDLPLIARSMGNDLMAPAESLLPEVGTAYTALQKRGFLVSGMTGSGSCLFALSHDKKAMKEAEKAFGREGYDVRLTKTKSARVR